MSVVISSTSSSQNRGHNIAELDPLGILEADLSSTYPRELAVGSYGLGRIFNLIKMLLSFNKAEAPMFLATCLQRLINAVQKSMQRIQTQC